MTVRIGRGGELGLVLFQEILGVVREMDVTQWGRKEE